jgi:hypothetical protein
MLTGASSNDIEFWREQMDDEWTKPGNRRDVIPLWEVKAAAPEQPKTSPHPSNNPELLGTPVACSIAERCKKMHLFRRFALQFGLRQRGSERFR